MKKTVKLILPLVLPLTIILFETITKWRYVNVEDAPEDFLYGFPLAFIGRGWHTSLSLQIFVSELLFDFLVYFAFCFITVMLIDNYCKPIIIKKYLKFSLYGIAGLLLLFYGLIGSIQDNVFKMKRDFNYEEVRSGYKFIWQENKR